MISDHSEEQLAADTVEGDEAQLVEMRTSTRRSRCCRRVSSRVWRFEQLANQIGRSGEEHAPFLPGRFDAERDREVRFPSAGPGRGGISGGADAV